MFDKISVDVLGSIVSFIDFETMTELDKAIDPLHESCLVQQLWLASHHFRLGESAHEKVLLCTAQKNPVNLDLQALSDSRLEASQLLPTLRNFEQIRSISYSVQLFRAATFQWISMELFHSLTSLRSLLIDGCRSVIDVTPLSGCVGLRALRLNRFKVVGNLGALAACTGLEMLNLDQTDVSDISWLATCGSLRILSLRHTPIHSQDLDILTVLNKLQHLDVRDSGVTTLTLGSIRNLHILNVDDNTTISDIGTISDTDTVSDTLQKLVVGTQTGPGLVNTFLDDCRVMKTVRVLKMQTIEHISQFPNVSTLQLDHSSVNSLYGISHCVQLQVLDLSYTRIKSIEMLESCNKLRKLNLQGSPVRSLRGLGKCTQLDTLKIRQTEIVCLDELKKCEKLLYLDLPSLAQIRTDESNLATLHKLKNKGLFTDEDCRTLLNATLSRNVWSKSTPSELQRLIKLGAPVDGSDGLYRAIHHNCIPSFRLLLRAGAVMNTETMVYGAACNGHFGMVRTILRLASNDVRFSHHFQKLLTLCARSSATVKALLKCGGDIRVGEHVTNAVEKNFYNSLKLMLEAGAIVTSDHITSAVKKRELKLLKLLMLHSKNVADDAIDALYEARGTKCNLHVLETLLKCGVNANCGVARYGATPVVYWLDRYPTLDTLNVFIKHNVDMGDVDYHGRDVLFHQINDSKGGEVLEHLLRSKLVDVNRVDKFGMTPLLLACATSTLLVVQRLVHYGANLHHVDIRGANAMAFAIGRATRSAEVEQFLRDHGVTYEKTPASDLFELVNRREDEDEILGKIRTGAKVNRDDENIICTAINNGYSVRVVEALIDAGAHVAMGGNPFNTAREAVRLATGNLEMMSVLLKKGNVMLHCYKPILFCSHISSKEMVVLLLEHGACTTYFRKDELGSPVFMPRSFVEHYHYIEFLVDVLQLHLGFDVNTGNVPGGTSPLRFVLHLNRSFEAVESLLALGVDPNTTDSWGGTALMTWFGCRNRRNCCKVLKLFLDHGVDVDLHGHSGTTALHLALTCTFCERCTMNLLQKGAVVERKSLACALAWPNKGVPVSFPIVDLILRSGLKHEGLKFKKLSRNGYSADEMVLARLLFKHGVASLDDLVDDPELHRLVSCGRRV